MKKLDYLQSPFKTLLFALRPFRGRFILMCVFIAMGNVLADMIPYFFKIIADQVAENKSNVSFNDFIVPLVWITIIFIVHEIAFRIGHIIEAYIAPNTFKYVTESLFKGLIKRPTSYFENKFSGDLGRRIEQVASTSVYFVELFPWEMGWVVFATITSAFLLGIAHPYMFLTFFVWLVLFIVTSLPLLLWNYHASEKVAATHARLSGSIIDSLSNISLVHSFGATEYEQNLNRGNVDEVVKSERKTRWISICNKFQQGMSIALLGIALAVVSVMLFVQRQFTVGDFVIVASVIPAMTGVVWTLGDVVIRVSQHFGELSDAVLNLREKQEQLMGGETEGTLDNKYSIIFDNISFKYPGTEVPIFSNFLLDIKQGERVGIVGSSGAGKSTLVKLLLRQHEVGSGSISIGNVSINEFKLERFNKLMSYVPQDTSLFHRSLFDNIHYADPSASKEKVHEASVQARADEFIKTLPEGYETKVGERGVKLSGGQRQRIALARAILKDAPILILDEATSSLDSESEAIIQEALSDLFQNRTVIAIAHRLSTLRSMDRIIVLEAGKVVENGIPHELLNKSDSRFKQMWDHQKNGFV